MKTRLSFACLPLALLLLFAGCADKNETNEMPQGLGRVLFDALRADDKAAFDQYIYTDADRDELLKSIKADERLTENVKSETQQFILNYMQVDRPKLEASFSMLRQRALECGLQNWSDVEYITSTFSQKETYNLNRANVNVKFRWNGLEYELDLDYCLQTRRGWVLMTVPHLRCNS